MEFYIAMAISDVVLVNQTHPCGRGFFTYILNPYNCTVSDSQYFALVDVPNESTRIINYLQSLADGRFLIAFRHFCKQDVRSVLIG